MLDLGSACRRRNQGSPQPVLTSLSVEKRLKVSRPATLKALRQLTDFGILVEITGGPRGQLRWRAHEVLAILTDE